MEGLRTCYTCKNELPLDTFYKGESYRDGYDIYCKNCAKERKRNNLQFPIGTRNPIKVNKVGLVWCPKCKEYKNEDLFYLDNSSKVPKYSIYCKNCDNFRHKTNKHIELCKKYYLTNIKNNPTKFIEERNRKLEVWKKYKNTPK